MISFGGKLRQHAERQPDHPAVSCGEDTLSYRELHRRSNRTAHGLAERGVEAGRIVVVALPNGLDFVIVCQAIWTLGATPLPVSFRIPERELADIVVLADAVLVVGDVAFELGRPVVSAAALDSSDDSDLPDRTPPVAKAVTSGGSTGKPKLILSGGPGATELESPASGLFGLGPQSVALMPGPLYHNGPFVTMMMTLAYGGHFVLLPRFDAEATLAAIDRHQANWLYLVPTMMNRIWRLPPETRAGYDIASVRMLWHMAAPCPPWLKLAFIEWFSPEVVMELYAGTEAIATTVISGVEWLAHRGSVGRVAAGEIKIVGRDGNEVAPGDVGEIFMRRAAGTPETYRYVGASAKAMAGGWESLGDLGWFDADDYLYLADRQTDMILVGGSNVYPAEVEAAIEEHPAVRSSVVIGLPDEDLGSRIHAIIDAADVVTEDDLLAHLSSRLVSYKRPRSFEFVDKPLRNDAGKVRRSALRDARL
jgi:bile acid-coenzyme A ligase